MAMAAKTVEGIGEIRTSPTTLLLLLTRQIILLAMNVAFAVSSAVGSVVGGQMYDGLADGWSATL